jgi:hypothetical protein
MQSDLYLIKKKPALSILGEFEAMCESAATEVKKISASLGAVEDDFVRGFDYIAGFYFDDQNINQAKKNPSLVFNSKLGCWSPASGKKGESLRNRMLKVQLPCSGNLTEMFGGIPMQSGGNLIFMSFEYIGKRRILQVPVGMSTRLPKGLKKIRLSTYWKWKEKLQ